jgi:hypothetical protein
VIFLSRISSVCCAFFFKGWKWGLGCKMDFRLLAFRMVISITCKLLLTSCYRLLSILFHAVQCQRSLLLTQLAFLFPPPAQTLHKSAPSMAWESGLYFVEIPFIAFDRGTSQRIRLLNFPSKNLSVFVEIFPHAKFELCRCTAHLLFTSASSAP